MSETEIYNFVVENNVKCKNFGIPNVAARNDWKKEV